MDEEQLKEVLIKMDEKQINCKCVCKYLLRELFLTFRYKRKKNGRKRSKRISKTSDRKI